VLFGLIQKHLLNSAATNSRLFIFSLLTMATESDFDTVLVKLQQDVQRVLNQVSRVDSKVSRFEQLLASSRAAQVEPDKSWLSTNAAVDALTGQGIRRPQQLLDLVRWQILPVDGEYVRNSALSPGKPRYEFNVTKCAEQIAEWKSLDAQERKGHIERLKA